MKNNHIHIWRLWFEGVRFYADRCLVDGCRATRQRWKSGVMNRHGHELSEQELRIERRYQLSDQDVEAN